VPEPSDKSVPQVVNELWALTKDYARQETVDPLKGIGRYLAYGLAGAVLTSIGVILLLLALLRFIQAVATPELTGNWSWVPYLVVLAVGSVLIALAVNRISSRNGRKS
jgi:hypothetical protein